MFPQFHIILFLNFLVFIYRYTFTMNLVRFLSISLCASIVMETIYTIQGHIMPNCTVKLTFH